MKIKLAFYSAILTIVTIIVVFLVGNKYEMKDTANKICKRNHPFYIAPVLNEFNYDTLPKVIDSLNKLEPTGPAGKIQIGYTISIPVLSLYKWDKRKKEFIFDETKVFDYLEMIKTIKRPVVIYLMADHFSPTCELVDWLKQDKRNFMQLNNGEIPQSQYFMTEILPFTLSVDPALSVNSYRFAAFKRTAELFNNFEKENADLIIGYTINGETHHLFPNFSSGTGEYDSYLITDYSDQSITEFQDWLSQHYNLQDLNSLFGSNFSSWQEVLPPSKNISVTGGKVWEHIDSYAHGQIPIYGWINGLEGKTIDVYLDGILLGQAVYGLNRMDVYQTKESIHNPNVGFRYNIDYRNISVGEHLIEVKIGYDLFGSKKLFIAKDSESLTKTFSADITEKQMQFLGNLDGPESYQVLYNPLAEIWQEFRSHQVTNYLKKANSILVEAGISQNKIYSHQVLASLNGGWNETLFASDTSLASTVSYNLGVNLYGGLTNNLLVDNLVSEKRFGSPEFNPQTFKTPDYFKQAIMHQYEACSDFISPYFFGIIVTEDFEHEKMNILGENNDMGAKYFYQAIKQMAEK